MAKWDRVLVHRSHFHTLTAKCSGWKCERGYGDDGGIRVAAWPYQIACSREGTKQYVCVCFSTRLLFT